MAENSKIEWTDHTFNPWIGCTKVSAACDHCYAEAWDARGLQQRETRWGPHADRTRTSAANWRKPMAWNKAAAAAGTRARVFCASLADVFDNHRSISDEWRAGLWRLIADTPHLDWLLLTKRPQNITKMLPDQFGLPAWGNGWANVWLGTTAENQTEANRRIPHLLAVPAAVRFLSMEPLLGPVDLTEIADHRPDLMASVVYDVLRGTGGLHGPIGKIDWVIVGGESGPHARPMHPDWAISLRDQCAAAGVPFLFKQWGEWGAGSYNMLTGQAVFRAFPNFQTWVNKASTWVNGGTCMDAKGRICKLGADMMRARDEDAFPVTITHRIGKARAGRLLDGVEHNGFPQIGGDA